MLNFLRTILLLFAAFQLTAEAIPAHEQSGTAVPFTFEKGNVIVQAKIKGNVPVEVVLATGSEHSYVDTGLLDKYKLQRAYAGIPPVTGSPSDQIYFFSTVPNVSVGEAKATSLNMHLGSMQELSNVIGREIFASLGADFFKGRVARFDFQKQLVTFLDPSAAKAERENSTGDDRDRTIVLKMLESGSAYREPILVPLVEGITFDGKRAKVVLNTGIVTVITLSSSTAKKLGLTIPAEKSAALTDKIGSLKLGTYELTSVPVIIASKGTNLDHSLGDTGAVIGSAFLQNFLVTFDYRGKTVTLKPVKPGA
jgi:hypothetical protein